MDKDVLTRRREFIFDHPPSHSIQEGCMVVYDGSVTGRVRKVFRDPYSENPDVYLVALQLDGEPPERIKSDTGIELVQTKHRNILLCALQKCELQEIAMHRTTAASSLDPPSKDSTKDVRQEDLVYDHPPDHPIQKESMVIYNHHNQRTAGVVKLIFRDKTSETPDMYMAALELSEALPTCTPGVYRELQLVQTPHGNILFCPLDHCALDRQRQKRIRHRVADDVIASGGNPSGPVNIPQNPHKELVFDHSPSHAIQEGSIVVYDGNVTGCVRSVFRDPNSKYPHLFLVALELLDPTAADTDIIFCPLDLCEPDHQFLETSTNTVTGSGISLPGQIPYKELAQTGATTPDKTAPLPDQEQQIPTAVKPHGDRMRSVDRAAAGHLFGQDSAQQIAHRGLIFNHSPAHPIQEGSTVVYNGTITGCVGKIFKDPNSKYPKVPLVALLLDEELPECTRGDYMGFKVIDSPSRNVLFCPVHKCELAERARHKGPVFLVEARVHKRSPAKSAASSPKHEVQRGSLVRHSGADSEGFEESLRESKTEAVEAGSIASLSLSADQPETLCIDYQSESSTPVGSAVVIRFKQERVTGVLSGICKLVSEGIISMFAVVKVNRGLCSSDLLQLSGKAYAKCERQLPAEFKGPGTEQHIVCPLGMCSRRYQVAAQPDSEKLLMSVIAMKRGERDCRGTVRWIGVDLMADERDTKLLLEMDESFQGDYFRFEGIESSHKNLILVSMIECLLGITLKPSGETQHPVPIVSEQTTECTLCYEREINCVLIPCGHTLCKVCADKLTSCPWCDQQIKERQKVYI